MSHWNRAYLDALEVPVWVPLNIPSVDDEGKGEASETIEEETSPQAKSATTPLYSLLSGQPDAKVVFLVSSTIDPEIAAATLKQLQFAWKAWLEQPLSACLVQESKESPAKQQLNLSDLKGSVVDCREEQDSDPSTYVKAPVFNFQKADKKAWWQVLQQLQ